MIAVLFEAILIDGKKTEYIELATNLKEELNKIEGFISIERFQSIQHPEKILSLSFWKNEESVTQWRNITKHRQVQSYSRTEIFKHYRLRVASIIRDYTIDDRNQAPTDSTQKHQ